MVTALIVINQSGKPSGSPGVSRDDLELGASVVLTNNDNTGANSWLWEMESKPVGSSAVISGATLPTASFTPDVAGSYLVKLTVDGPSVDPDTDTRIAAIKTDYLGMRKPASGERLEFDAVDGWGAALQAALDALDADAAAGLKADGSVPLTERAGDPATQSNKGSLYAKDVSGTTHLFYKDSAGATYQITPALGGDELAKVSANDTTAGYLNGKLVAGANITLTELNNGSNETLRIAADGNTLDQSYDQGGAGAGRAIDADAGPVFVNAAGAAAVELDGYLALDEIDTPSALTDSGLLYAKDVSAISELHYLDSSGQEIQVTNDGYLATDGYSGTVHVSASLAFVISDGLIKSVIAS